jgi:hypothetical protein
VFTPLFYILCRRIALRFTRSVPKIRLTQGSQV